MVQAPQLFPVISLGSRISYKCHQLLMFMNNPVWFIAFKWYCLCVIAICRGKRYSASAKLLDTP